MKKFVLAAIAVATMASASAFTWVQSGQSVDKTTTWSVAKETTRIDKTDDNQQIVVSLGRAEVGEQTYTYQWYVTIHDCKQGYGTFRFLNTNGQWIQNTDFSFGAGNIVSNTAEGLCAWALEIGLPAQKAKAKPAAKPGKTV